MPGSPTPMPKGDSTATRSPHQVIAAEIDTEESAHDASPFHVYQGGVNLHVKITAGPKLDPRAEKTKKGNLARSQIPFEYCDGAEGGI